MQPYSPVLWIFTLLVVTLIAALTGLISGLVGVNTKPAIEQAPDDPYQESSTNTIYNLLFCDKPELYKEKIQEPLTYPFDILFSEKSSVDDLQTVIDDVHSDTRAKVLAYNRQLALGRHISSKEVLGVIIEVGLDNGLDVLASFKDGTARYINYTGKILVWEATDLESDQLTDTLFDRSGEIVNNIGVWNNPRLSHPIKGNVRITFLVSDGLYFGEGPIDVLFNDAMAGPALTTATELMKYLTEKSVV